LRVAAVAGHERPDVRLPEVAGHFLLAGPEQLEPTRIAREWYGVS
jgi:hypothetical protein